MANSRKGTSLKNCPVFVMEVQLFSFISSDVYSTRLSESYRQSITYSVFLRCTEFDTEFRQSIYKPQSLGIGSFIFAWPNYFRVGNSAVRLHVEADNDSFVTFISVRYLYIILQPFFEQSISSGKFTNGIIVYPKIFHGFFYIGF